MPFPAMQMAAVETSGVFSGASMSESKSPCIIMGVVIFLVHRSFLSHFSMRLDMTVQTMAK